MKNIILILIVAFAFACNNSKEHGDITPPSDSSVTKTDTSNHEEPATRRKPGGGGGGSTSIPAPTGLTASVTPNGVYLQWNSVPNSQGYWIYRNGYVPAIVQTLNYTDAVQPGTYAYAVAAVVNTVLGQKSSSITVVVQ